MKIKNINLGKYHLLAIYYLLFLFIIPRYILLPVSDQLNWNYDMINEWYFLICTTALMYYAVKIYKDKLYEDWLKVKNRKLGVILTGILGLFLVIVLNVILVLIINGGQTVKSVNQKNIEDTSFLFKFFMPVLLVIIGPILEELVFRTYIMDILKEKITIYGASILSVILFTLIHMHSLSDDVKTLIPYVSMGIVTVLTYLWKKRNVYYVFAIHIFNNLLVQFVLWFS